MTSKLTREERVQALYDLKVGQVLSLADIENVKMLSRMALSAMDSKPVAWWTGPEPTPTGEIESIHDHETGSHSIPLYPLYRHAQQPVVQQMMFIDGDISSEDADKLAKVIRKFNEEDERPLAKMARIIRENPHPTNECDMPKAQPAPVVPEEATPDSIEILASARRRDHAVFQWDEDQRNAAADSWNACRAAMLQELQKSAGAEATCRSNKNVQDLQVDNSPAIPDGYVMVPVEPNGDMLAAAQDAYGETDGDIASTLRAAMLAAAPQEVK
ncbi:hypothetical protein [Klebsiella pneumoniae]|jgi:hypothetical protein|uniref:hypothetical protein n=1 Tax=Klebsiella pneumoniae TaxID=573 RepID=UPI0027D30D5E|nr:hypothetical protein [Klebsiella pneumoniae]